ncbi:MAG: hypothetical protein KC484_04415 [Colwelliaceae bacterium]|nr:hypothetical protein [Colwelliaceae bacterium]
MMQIKQTSLSRFLTQAAFIICTLTNLSLHAETLWSDNSLSYLKNTSDFQLITNDNINVITFEHASGHNWGDVFFFADRTTASADINHGERKETYGEVSARLSFSYLQGQPIAGDYLKDIYIASTYEHSTGTNNGSGFGFNNYLLGIGASWKLPKFSFVNTNIYYATNDKVDNDVQLTVSWGLPFTIGKQKFTFDGFFDWASAADDHTADFHFNPQLKWDLGHHFGKDKFLELGVEYSFWHNKFGINGLDDESVISALIKIHL